MINPFFLKYFHDSVQEHSIFKAAELNRVSPTAISAAIKKLEEYYQFDLLVHKKNQFLVTEEGRQLFEKIPLVLQAYVDLEKSVTPEESVAGKIRIAATYSIAISILPSFIQYFQTLFPQITIEIKIAEHGMIKYWIDKGLVNLGLSVRRNDSSKKFQVDEIETGDFKLVKKKGTEQSKFVVAGDWPEVLDLKKKYKRKYGQKLPVLFDSPSWIFSREFVLNGTGIALLPQYLITDQLEEIEWQDELLSYTLAFLRKKERSLTTIEQLLVDHLKSFRAQ